MDQQTADLIKSEAGGKIADLINRLAGPLADECGMMLGDTARVFRIKNWVRTVEKTERILKDAGLPPKAVPSRLFLPITEACSVEDNETLQEMWAGLLATSSQRADTVSPSFVETLKQLTPVEARYLGTMYDSEKAAHPNWKRDFIPISYHSLTERGGLPDGVTADTLERLGFIRREYKIKLEGFKELKDTRSLEGIVSVVDRMALSDVDYDYFFTAFAAAFLEACRGPAQDGSDSSA